MHVISQDGGWAVVREGEDPPSSVHPTQAEAAKAGRETARRNGATFLLHAKDGRVRDRRDYGGDPGAREGTREGSVAQAARKAGGAVERVDGTVGGTVDDPGVTQSGARADETSGETSDGTREAGGLTDEERYANYEVHDRSGEWLGKVDSIFLDEDDRLEYIGLKIALLGGRSVLIPARAARFDDGRRVIEVAADRRHIEAGPAFDDEREVTPRLEREAHGHYGLGQKAQGGAYGDHPPLARQHGGEGLRRAGAEEEVRVQRSEEELRVGTARREAGTVRVRKRVRTDLERVEVPVTREEVHVERVPVTGKTSEGVIGEDEIVVPVTEEEIVVSKKPVVKEEIRVRKDAVEETQVIEEDVRREEIDVENDSGRRGV